MQDREPPPPQAVSAPDIIVIAIGGLGTPALNVKFCELNA